MKTGSCSSRKKKVRDEARTEAGGSQILRELGGKSPSPGVEVAQEPHPKPRANPTSGEERGVEPQRPGQRGRIPALPKSSSAVRRGPSIPTARRGRSEDRGLSAPTPLPATQFIALLSMRHTFLLIRHMAQPCAAARGSSPPLSSPTSEVKGQQGVHD